MSKMIFNRVSELKSISIEGAGTHPDATAYNNPGYCRGDNYCLMYWRVASIRVERFRSLTRRAFIVLQFAALRSRRLICKNELAFFIRTHARCTRYIARLFFLPFSVIVKQCSEQTRWKLANSSLFGEDTFPNQMITRIFVTERTRKKQRDELCN